MRAVVYAVPDDDRGMFRRSCGGVSSPVPSALVPAVPPLLLVAWHCGRRLEGSNETREFKFKRAFEFCVMKMGDSQKEGGEGGEGRSWAVAVRQRSGESCGQKLMYRGGEWGLPRERSCCGSLHPRVL